MAHLEMVMRQLLDEANRDSRLHRRLWGFWLVKSLADITEDNIHLPGAQHWTRGIRGRVKAGAKAVCNMFRYV